MLIVILKYFVSIYLFPNFLLADIEVPSSSIEHEKVVIEHIIPLGKLDTFSCTCCSEMEIEKKKSLWFSRYIQKRKYPSVPSTVHHSSSSIEISNISVCCLGVNVKALSCTQLIMAPTTYCISTLIDGNWLATC